MFSKSIILAAAAALLASPAAAAEAVPATAAPRAADSELVEIPFAPPLGRTLRYRMGRDGAQGGEQRRTDAVVAIFFRRSGEDYVMSMRMEMPAGLPPPSGTTAIGQLLRRPIEFRVSADGEILELLDIERLWATSERVLDEAFPATADNGAERQAVAQMLRQMRALSPEAQRDLFARNIAPLLTAAGTAFVVGETVSGSGRAESVIGDVDHQASLRLDGADGHIARLSGRSSVSSEALEAGLRSIVAGLPATGRPVPAFRVVSNEVVETFEVSMETGLTQRYRAEQILVMEENGVPSRGVRVQTLELIP